MPLGANTPPDHLSVKLLRPDIVVVSRVFFSGSIINTLVLFLGTPYIFPLFAQTQPFHFLISLDNPDNKVVLTVCVKGSIINTLVLV